MHDGLLWENAVTSAIKTIFWWKKVERGGKQLRSVNHVSLPQVCFNKIKYRSLTDHGKEKARQETRITDPILTFPASPLYHLWWKVEETTFQRSRRSTQTSRWWLEHVVLSGDFIHPPTAVYLISSPRHDSSRQHHQQGVQTQGWYVNLHAIWNHHLHHLRLKFPYLDIIIHISLPITPISLLFLQPKARNFSEEYSSFGDRLLAPHYVRTLSKQTSAIWLEGRGRKEGRKELPQVQ